MRRLVLLALFLVLPLHAPSLAQVYEVAFPSLTFTFPTDIQQAGDGTNRLFVAEMAGQVLAFPNDPTVQATTVFLDIQDRVLSNDRFGLLGFTFHPNYATNGYLFVHYIAAGPDRSVIARFTRDPEDPNRANPDSEVVLLEVEQPHKFHNGGQLAFGPDGYLYIPLGDGGPVGNIPDPSGHGQNRSTLLGSVLRIDVEQASGDLPYAIPEDNPFVGNTEGIREETWAYGFRNPWRVSFDTVTGWLWAGENGEDSFEEIDIVEAGKNYGWKTMEGTACFSPSFGCVTTEMAMPVWEYGGTLVRRSVIGGPVYRGSANPELYGKYLFADYRTGEGWGLTYDGTAPAAATLLFDDLPDLTTFGLDEQGEVYMARLADGKLYRFAPTVTTIESETKPAAFHLAQNFPNPFNPSTTIAFTLRQPTDVSVMMYDAQGRWLTTLFDGPLGSGSHHVSWDGTQTSGAPVPSGVYFYRLRTPSGQATRALMLIK